MMQLCTGTVQAACATRRLCQTPNTLDERQVAQLFSQTHAQINSTKLSRDVLKSRQTAKAPDYHATSSDLHGQRKI